MSDTPRTDKCLTACLWSGGATAGPFKSESNIYCVAQDLERENGMMRAALNHIISQYGGMMPDEGCDCDDCRFIKPIYAAMGLPIANIAAEKPRRYKR
jgi:hypothetical protein